MHELIPIPKPGVTHVHREKGDRYKVLLVTDAPDDGDRAERYPRTVIYQGADGRTWPKPLLDFHAKMQPDPDAPAALPDDGQLFRTWIRLAATEPAKVARALLNCLTEDEYRAALTQLMGDEGHAH